MENNLQYLEPTFYECTDGGSLKVVELEKQGEAELTVSSKYKAISFAIKAGNGFSYLMIKNTPDGLIFEKKPDDTWILHVFECKKTVTEKAWRKAKKQFEGEILHANMLRGLLNLPEFKEIKVYTVYRESKLLENTPNPSLYRQPVGQKITTSPYRDWNNERLILLKGIAVPHERIVLDNKGKGKYDL